MTGIVFNLLEEVVTRFHGENAWDGLLDATGLEGAYTAPGDYPDRQWDELVEAAARELGMPRFELLRWFGREAVPLLAERYPQAFAPHRGTRPFLLGLKKASPVGMPRVFAETAGADLNLRDTPHGLALEYRSPRRLCALAQGLVEGTAAHYRERLEFDHRTCMLRGDEACLCPMRFEPERRRA